MKDYNKKLEDLVYDYPTKYKEGFTGKEIEDIVSLFPELNHDKFNDALMGITCMVIDELTIIYHCDILIALRCGIENRDMTLEEWD